jgi:hypothetical protein
MGSGASAETARTTVTSMLSGKPADASDIKVCIEDFLQVLNSKCLTGFGTSTS